VGVEIQLSQEAAHICLQRLKLRADAWEGGAKRSLGVQLPAGLVDDGHVQGWLARKVTLQAEHSILRQAKQANRQ
jgi:hypothetical protein